MNDIDELIERLKKLRHATDGFFARGEPYTACTISYKMLDEAITALQEMQKENKRLDAALAEMECLAESTPLAALGTFTEHIRKAREGEISTSP